MNNDRQNNRRGLLSQPPGSIKNCYLERTSRPIYAIAFLLPFIVFYELGTIRINAEMLGRSQIRVVAFVWLQNFAELLGLGAHFAWLAAPLLVVVILVALQITSRRSWKVQARDMVPMAIECLVLAVPLIVFSILVNKFPHTPAEVPAVAHASAATVQTPGAILANPAIAGIAAAGDTQVSWLTSAKGSALLNIVTGIGAGIYEEFVFRLILISLLMLLLQDVLKFSYRTSIILAVFIAAVLFSAHHHFFFLNGALLTGEAFSWPAFLFRTAAGLYFAAVFAIRGFGVTAGTHAFHNIIAALLNAA